jgi:hypothetical protein
MTRTSYRQRLLGAAVTLASLALLVYTVGAPHISTG